MKEEGRRKKEDGRPAKGEGLRAMGDGIGGARVSRLAWGSPSLQTRHGRRTLHVGSPSRLVHVPLPIWARRTMRPAGGGM